MSHSATAMPLQKYENAKTRNENLYEFLSKGLVPDFVIRLGIRAMLGQTIAGRSADSPEQESFTRQSFIEDLKRRPIAIKTEEANEQHYELPPEFFKLVLGEHLKYSCALWQDDWKLDAEHLSLAEKAMLDLSIARADIKDGQTILDLGCGWGALSLYLATNYPHSSVTCVSNSHKQRKFIQTEAERRGLRNLKVITANVDSLRFSEKFDRIVSVEMFEHMKNYELLLERISSWLVSEGKLFVHIFTHKNLQYHYEDRDGSDWLTRHFFEGGMMPSDSLLLYFQRDLQVAAHWVVSGKHYKKTAEVWLQNMDKKRKEILPILASTYGEAQSRKWFFYWRLFFMACAEIWGFRNGEEWQVSHYLFQKKS